MAQYSIGIDAGGTYTDAVVVDTDTHRVVAFAKSLTTHGDLATGVVRSLCDVFRIAGESIDRADIARVSLSTTLATNALVEGRGSSICVFLPGFDDRMVARTGIANAIPSAQLVPLAGGHQYTGHESEPLDEAGLRSALAGPAGAAAAFAVAGHYAVRNPSHERCVEAIITELTGAPVSASCDLSDSLDGPRRALTAAFNARIISLIFDLEAAVRSAMASLELDVPLMMVKGDGSLARSEAVRRKPIETILSGPAASVIGARYLSGMDEFVIADVGGTTTDVATVRNGWPGLNSQGADVGGYRTLVKAIDMRTLGLGGDSEVDLDESGQIRLGKNRCVPLSLLADQYPGIVNELSTALLRDGGMRSSLRYLVAAANDTVANGIQSLSAREKSFLERLSGGQPTLYEDVVHKAADRAAVTRLRERGLIQVSGVTPSDAAHVLGLQSQWSAPAATLACELLGRAAGRISGAGSDDQVVKFARDIHCSVSESSARIVIEQLAGITFPSNDPLINAAASAAQNIRDLQFKISPGIPLVAVGGPASVIYPEVASRLNADLVVPDHSVVANAVGAAAGTIKVTGTVEVTLNEDGGYSVHGEGHPLRVDGGTVALEKAAALARLAAEREFAACGGNRGHVAVTTSRIDVPGAEGENGLVSAVVTAECGSVAPVSRGT